MLADAVNKIRTEMTSNASNPYVQAVGQFLVAHLEANPAHAEKVLSEGKTVAKSLDEMRKVAEKKKSGGVAVLTDAEGFAIVLKYFGIDGRVSAPAQLVATPVVAAPPVPASSGFDVNLDDFL